MEELVEEIEQQEQFRKTHSFHSFLNQPNLIALNSTDAVVSTSTTGFSSFAVNLPRPALDVESIQLVNANIPQCVQNIPDTACVFWYYRLSEYSGKVPNPNNLFMVRLLPSYYKPEFIANPTTYGCNETFNSYQDVANQLALSCATDLTYTNLAVQSGTDQEVYNFHYLPGEITLPYNAGLNKFQMVGTNATTQLAYKDYDAGTTYALNDVVYVGTKTYISLQSGNVGNLPTTSPTWWKRNYVEIVEPYDVNAPYRAGQYVSYNNQLYYAVNNTYGGSTPNIDTTNWTTTLPTNYSYRYLITGYADPNVSALQGNARQQWNGDALFELGSYVGYNGSIWSANTQNKGFVPFTLNNAYTWTNGIEFELGDCVLYNGVFYQSTINNNIGLQPDLNPADWSILTWNNTFYTEGNIVSYLGIQYQASKNIPAGANPPPTNSNWVSLSYDASTYYSVGSIVSYAGVFWISTAPSVGQGPTLFSQYWSPNLFWSYIKPSSSTTYPQPPYVGIHYITSQFDYVDVWNGVAQYPFPIGQAGQPYSINPKRLLNSILGFTWNGVMNPEIFANIDGFTTSSSTSTTITELYNRLRPVPEYFVRYTGLLRTGLTSQTATSSQTYTADGYCNLVYSSVMSIYASIVYGSTLNSTRNTNLLALGTMDCGNLGVSYFNPIVNNPLHIHGDLYSVELSFYDEAGDPYFFTNNAILTFVLKVLYKKDEDKNIA